MFCVVFSDWMEREVDWMRVKKRAFRSVIYAAVWAFDECNNAGWNYFK